jgi:predicted dehydrogenase
LRAAIIGHTGAGDYGHGYDQIFKDLDNVSVQAVADPDAAGRRKAAERAGAPRMYADYREMLEKEKPHLVSIAMRQPREHKTIALAAIEAGASLFMEKPMTETVAEADDILAAADQHGAKIVVAHNRRYSPEFANLKALLAEGFLGQVREVRLQGKQDARAGGEDMLVLGTHDFDLLRFYFGDPLWCFATVTQDGRDVTRQDVRSGREPMRVAGDSIHALFTFARGVRATWCSVKTADGWNTSPPRRENWAFEILGTRRVVGYQSSPGFYYLDSPYLLQPGDGARWQPLPPSTQGAAPLRPKHMGRDLVHAVETNTQPLCSGADGRWAIEMVSAVYQSHLAKARVTFPLVERSHPLG